jgi:FG-GAP repeat protein
MRSPVRILLALATAVCAVGVPAVAHARTQVAPARSVAPGVTDFNGDGKADLAVASLNGDAGAKKDTGGVNVLYGGAGGLQTTNPASQYWTANSQGMPVPAQVKAEFGFALATGDFNGDGRSDLAASAPRQDVFDGSGNHVDAGAVYVVYGSATGLQTGSPAAQFFAGNTAGFPTAAVDDALLGRSLTTGDFDGDGFADLAIGAPRQDLGAITQAGVAAVLYGSSAGLGTAGSQLWTEDSPGVPDQAESQDWFARSLASGDFNGDSYGDLAVGVPLEDQTNGTQHRKDSGAAIVIYGSSAGLRATSPAAQYWDQDSSHVRDHVERGDYFAHNLATADFNGDGFADLAMGDRLENLEGHPTKNDAGAVNVLYGAASGLQTDAPQNQFWTQDSRHLHDSADRGEQFGFSLAAADFNDDGYPDLAIGAAFENLGLTVRGAGSVHVLYGGPNRLQADQPENQFWTQDSPNVLDHVETLDLFGFSLAANDFNGDGRVDLAIGVLHEDLEGSTTIVNAGAVNVLYGGVNGLQTDNPPNQLWDQNSSGTFGGAADLNQFGWWMA